MTFNAAATTESRFSFKPVLVVWLQALAFGELFENHLEDCLFHLSLVIEVLHRGTTSVLLHDVSSKSLHYVRSRWWFALTILTCFWVWSNCVEQTFFGTATTAAIHVDPDE